MVTHIRGLSPFEASARPGVGMLDQENKSETGLQVVGTYVLSGASLSCSNPRWDRIASI